MATARTVAWVERLVWILIYVGLFAVVIGIATLPSSRVAAWSLIVLGSVFTVAGAILVWLRSVLGEPH